MTTPLIAIVCGSRSSKDRASVWRALDTIKPTVVIHGGATGVDELAASWAQRHGVDVVTCEALWSTEGKKAGPRRNGFMAQLAIALATARSCNVVCVALPGGRGTASMVGIARANDIEVLTADYAGEVRP